MDLEGFEDLETAGRNYVFKPFCFTLVGERKDRRPPPRSGHRLISDGRGNLYCYGGYNPNIFANIESDLGFNEEEFESQPLFKEVWKYNFANGRWRRMRVGNIPNELVSCALVHYKNCITVFGGTGYPFGAFSSNAVAMCDVSKSPLNFEILNVEGEMPNPQYGQGYLLDDSTFYTVGGTTGYDYSLDIHKLDLVRGQWEVVYKHDTFRNSELFGRYRHELAYDGQRLYLLGGGTQDINASLEQLPAFDLISKKWETLKCIPDAEHGYPLPRKYHSSVKLPGQLKYLVIGGYDGNDVLSDCWLLDLKHLQWKYMPSMNLPLATYFHGSSITPSGKLYTFGGVHHKYKHPERTSSMFSAWLGIPSLKEICWDAVKHYKFTKYLSKTELSYSGLPLQYLDEME